VTRFGPWEFMLDVDEVNYSRRELLAYSRRAALPVVNLSSGTNHLPPPALLVQSGLRAAVDPECFHDYDGPAGHQLARVAVAAHENLLGAPDVELTDDNVVVTAGASGAMHLAARALREHLDEPAPEALLPVPTFPLAGACLAHAGYAVREVVTAARDRWLPTPAELGAAAGPRTRLVYVNTFNNPTGEHYSAAELAELVGWARDRGVHVLHDQVSSGVSLDRATPNLLAIAARHGYADGVITVGSLSKSRAIPGFRSGWLVAGRRLAALCGRLNELTAPSSVSIAAPLVVLDRLLTGAIADVPFGGAAGPGRLARLVDGFVCEVERGEPAGGACRRMAATLAALLGRAELLAHLCGWYADLRDVLRRNVRLLDGRFARLVAGGTPWRGDFNTFVRLPALDGADYLPTTHRLFRDHGLQTLPGPAFGMRPAWWSERGYWLRLSFALPPDQWTEGLQRLEELR